MATQCPGLPARPALGLPEVASPCRPPARQLPTGVWELAHRPATLAPWGGRGRGRERAWHEEAPGQQLLLACLSASLSRSLSVSFRLCWLKAAAPRGVSLPASGPSLPLPLPPWPPDRRRHPEAAAGSAAARPRLLAPAPPWPRLCTPLPGKRESNPGEGNEIFLPSGESLLEKKTNDRERRLFQM